MVTVGKAGDIPPGARVVLRAGGEEIVVFNIDGEYYAISNICPHGSFRLSLGPLVGEGVVCPGHRWVFSVKTGRCMTKRFTPARTFRVWVEGDEVKLEVPNTTEEVGYG
ncbi:MAG: Rieske 2Fe-2S domain-containing protein [Candidatus Methanosuratincola sp.]